MIELVGNNELDRHMWLDSLLKQGIYEVTFTKIDGSTRVMPCTLKADLLPARTQSESKISKPRPLHTENISVYATDVQGWRSFRVMNLTNIRLL